MINHTTLTEKETWAIEVKDLVKSFSGRRVLNEFSLRVRQGEICGFLGPNGSGKTTTIRLLCGLLTPDSGSGACLGYDIYKEASFIRSHVGYMTQKFSLYDDLTVVENLTFIARMYGLARPKMQVEESLVNFAIPDKYKHQLAGTLSGGWKQRLALAATMLHKPKLLLLDEPTAGVDPDARREFWEHIHSLAEEGVTTLVSTHYMDEAERCHHLAYLAHGDLLAEGSVKELIEQADIAAIDIRGDNLTELADRFSRYPTVYQVAQFGHTLHISGADNAVLEELMQPFKATHRWEAATPTLEDVFIYFIQKNKEDDVE